MIPPPMIRKSELFITVLNVVLQTGLQIVLSGKADDLESFSQFIFK
jgi:hypothetical protein